MRKKNYLDHISDLTYNMECKDCILSPTTFALMVKRNLTSGWYKDYPQMVSLYLFSQLLFRQFIVHDHHSQEISGRLHSIELNFVAQDYQIIMQILENNMKEGQDEFKKPKRPKRASTTTRQEPSKGEHFRVLFKLI